EQGHHYVQIAWPTAAIRESNGAFLGFAMPLLDMAATSELEPILQERQARAAGLPTGLGAKLTLAANLAGVVAALHRQQHFVIDLKPVNLRFYRQSLYIAMLDCDGFSIAGQRARFAADQFTPDYLAPEFQAKGIPAGAELAQDLFALAVVIFRLLNFGIHPFTGKPASERVPSDIPSRIRGGYYAYGKQPNPQMAPSPVSGHALMPASLRALFDQAFASRHRPSAADWSALLAGFAQRDGALLLACAKDPHHQHFAGLACAACARDRLLQQLRQQAPQTRSKRTSTSGRGATPRSAIRGQPRGVAATRQGYAGWITAFVLLASLAIWAYAPDSHSPEDWPIIVQTSTQARAPVTPTQPAPPLPVVMPATTQPDRAAIQAEVMPVLDALSRSDVPAYRARMAALRAAATRRPRAQPASLQLYYHVQSKPVDGTQTASLDAAYRKIIHDDPYASFAAIELGRRLLRTGHSASARPLFMQAVWVDPGNPQAWYGVAQASGAEADNEAAAYAVAELLFSSPTEAEA
ncbi:MAG: hypothetical protein ACTS5I_01755, partial [Rhodanobacter sp.]